MYFLNFLATMSGETKKVCRCWRVKVCPIKSLLKNNKYVAAQGAVQCVPPGFCLLNRSLNWYLSTFLPFVQIRGYNHDFQETPCITVSRGTPLTTSFTRIPMYYLQKMPQLCLCPFLLCRLCQIVVWSTSDEIKRSPVFKGTSKKNRVLIIIT